MPLRLQALMYEHLPPEMCHLMLNIHHKKALRTCSNPNKIASRIRHNFTTFNSNGLDWLTDDVTVSPDITTKNNS